MLTHVLNMQKTKKYIFQGLLFLIGFLAIYFIVDYLNMDYTTMNETYGAYLVIINISLNIIMALSSALMMNLSTAMVELRAGKGNGSNLGFISVLFGILTYGCTSCVIAFFAAVGINLIVVALPFAGLPYKLISLVLLALGMYLIVREINHGTCKVDLTK